MIVTILGVFSCLEGRLWSGPTTSDGDWAARLPPSRSGPHQGTSPGHWGHRGSEVRGSRIIMLAALHLQVIKYTITVSTLNGSGAVCCTGRLSGSPDPTSTWCCWTRMVWTTRDSSLPPHPMSSSHTSTITCWMKKNDIGWSCTETTVTKTVVWGGQTLM